MVWTGRSEDPFYFGSKSEELKVCKVRDEVAELSTYLTVVTAGLENEIVGLDTGVCNLPN